MGVLIHNGRMYRRKSVIRTHWDQGVFG